MNHFIQKSILFGVGVYSKAQKELERSVKGLIKKNKISRKEGEAVLESFVKSSKTAQAKMERDIIYKELCDEHIVNDEQSCYSLLNTS